MHQLQMALIAGVSGFISAGIVTFILIHIQNRRKKK